MIRSRKTLGNLAVAAAAATTFLTSALAPGRPTEARSAPAQEPARVEIKVEVKQAVEAPAKGVLKNAAVRAPRRAVAPAANVEAMAPQFVQNLRPILGVELRFFSSACEPSAAQRRQVAIEGGKALKQAARKIAEAQLGVNQAVRRGQTNPEPRKLIRDAMLAAAKEALPPDQFDRYRKELESRADDQKQVVVLNLVANLDRLLFLNTEQRDKLTNSLASHWDERTYPTLENMAIYEAYYPVLPDQSITPILTEEQRKIWRTAQKINFSSIVNFNAFGQGMVNGADEGADDEDEKAALAEGVAR